MSSGGMVIHARKSSRHSPHGWGRSNSLKCLSQGQKMSELGSEAAAPIIRCRNVHGNKTTCIVHGVDKQMRERIARGRKGGDVCDPLSPGNLWVGCDKLRFGSPRIRSPNRAIL